MKYFGFLVSLFIFLTIALGLSLDLAHLPPLANLFSPFQGFWQNAYSEDKRHKDEITLHQLKSPVEVVYDEHLIPHIFASNEEDLYRVQGYVTAQHRLWQMEFQVLAAAGRIAGIVGPPALDFDRAQRRKGLSFGAEEGLRFLKENDPQTLQFLQAYAEGVNAYIDQLNFSDLPIEYKLLNYQPEFWTVEKTILLLKYMADMLVGDQDFAFTNLLTKIGKEAMDELFPDYPLENDPVIESTKIWDFEPLPIKKPQNLVYPDSLLLLSTMDIPPPGIGSNNWAVSGSKTKNGHPILANDPHLNLNMPSLWFAMQLSTPDFTVKGGSLPGALGIIIGFNEHLAWGVTNATRDLRDWYSITFKDERRTEYLYNNRWIPSSVRIERIKVKNQPDFLDTVIYTHHGPVVYDKNFRSNAQPINFSLKWTAHEGSNESKTFLMLNKAQNHRSYEEALAHFTSPAQNFVFASREGDIGLNVQGKFPLKWEGQGKFLMDGNDPAYEWQGYIPSDHNPSTFNPERGFVSSANQFSVDISYPYYVFDPSFEHYRNRRINQQLSEEKEFTIEDMKALQNDNFHLHAAEILPFMLEYLQEEELIISAEAKTFLGELSNWDYYTNSDQLAPTLFKIWWENLEQLLWGKWGGDYPMLYPSKFRTSLLIKTEPESEFFDDPSSSQRETAKEIIRKSFEMTADFMGEWLKNEEDYSWGKYKNTSIMHLVPQFKSFSYPGVIIGGGPGIINATGSRHGASWRMVVELGEDITAYGIYPGGQSGNPGSKYYGNLIQKWASGEYIDISFRDPADNNDVLMRTEFTPK